jgi:L-alanine-DL-glutamate epimerase-like enolase superfamily enzyme
MHASMKITDIRCYKLRGTLEQTPEAYYEGHLATPLDVYQEFRAQAVDASGGLFPTVEDDTLLLEQAFVYVETDGGIRGIAGPLDRMTAQIILQWTDLLVDRNPLEIRKIWDLLYRHVVHDRRGKTMFAISAIDCALWDIRGKYHNEPVYRLLGGPTRERLPAYASMLWFPTTPDTVQERSREALREGYDAQKWFFHHGPGSGQEGIRANVSLAEAAREAVGPDHDIMFDAWTAWDRAYAIKMIDRLAPYDPAWLEEPVAADALEAITDVTSAAPFPIAGGEHEYTRWGFHELIRQDAFDVLQPDPLWAGGISEVDRICTLASVHEIPVAVHGLSLPACVHVVAAQPPTICPRVEYLMRPNEALQHFFANPIVPDGGDIALPDRSGLGIEIDENAFETRTELVAQ